MVEIVCAPILAKKAYLVLMMNGMKVTRRVQSITVHRIRAVNDALGSFSFSFG